MDLENTDLEPVAKVLGVPNGRFDKMGTMNQNNMRKIIVSEWVTLDGVFDADNMDQCWIPYDSVERQAYIKEGILASDVILLGGTTFATFRSCWKTHVYQCAVVVLRGKLSKIEEVFFGSACYVSQEAPLVALWDQTTRAPSLMREAWSIRQMRAAMIKVESDLSMELAKASTPGAGRGGLQETRTVHGI